MISLRLGGACLLCLAKSKRVVSGRSRIDNPAKEVKVRVKKKVKEREKGFYGRGGNPPA
jgi:hypothetical protein